MASVVGARAAFLGQGIENLPLACWGLLMSACCCNSDVVFTSRYLNFFSRVGSDSQYGEGKNENSSPKSPPTISSDTS